MDQSDLNDLRSYVAEYDLVASIPMFDPVRSAKQWRATDVMLKSLGHHAEAGMTGRRLRRAAMADARKEVGFNIAIWMMLFRIIAELAPIVIRWWKKRRENQ